MVQISDRIQALAKTLLAIARGQVPNIGVAETLVDLGSLVDDLAAEMQPLMDDRRLRFEVQTKPLFAEVNSDGVRRMVAIFLDNAMKYTPAGGTVAVMVAEVGDRLEISVTDTGVGITETELSRIFERFYRVDASRDRQSTFAVSILIRTVQQIDIDRNEKLAQNDEMSQSSLCNLSRESSTSTATKNVTKLCPKTLVLSSLSPIL